MGAPIGPPAAPPPVPPQYPYTPPPTRGDSKPILVIVVVVVAVIAAIMLAAVVFVMGGGLLSGPGPGATPPSLTFTPAQPIANGFEFQLAGVSLSRPASTYRVELVVDGIVSGTPSILGPSLSFTVASETYTLTYLDTGGEGNLNSGDRFRLTREGGISNASEIRVDFLWTAGQVVGSQTYRSPPPTIAFGGKEPVTGGFQFQVAGATFVRPISSFRVNMLLNGTASTSGATALAASMAFTLSGQAYTLTYSDVGGEGNVGPGDQFRLTRNTGQLWQTATYTMVLLWSDGREVGSLTYP